MRRVVESAVGGALIVGEVVEERIGHHRADEGAGDAAQEAAAEAAQHAAVGAVAAEARRAIRGRPGGGGGAGWADRPAAGVDQRAWLAHLGPRGQARQGARVIALLAGALVLRDRGGELL